MDSSCVGPVTLFLSCVELEGAVAFFFSVVYWTVGPKVTVRWAVVAVDCIVDSQVGPRKNRQMVRSGVGAMTFMYGPLKIHGFFALLDHRSLCKIHGFSFLNY
jgi:hypothetical protein